MKRPAVGVSSSSGESSVDVECGGEDGRECVGECDGDVEAESGCRLKGPGERDLSAHRRGPGFRPAATARPTGFAGDPAPYTTERGGSSSLLEPIASAIAAAVDGLDPDGSRMAGGGRGVRRGDGPDDEACSSARSRFEGESGSLSLSRSSVSSCRSARSGSCDPYGLRRLRRELVGGEGIAASPAHVRSW